MPGRSADPVASRNMRARCTGNWCAWCHATWLTHLQALTADCGACPHVRTCHHSCWPRAARPTYRSALKYAAVNCKHPILIRSKLANSDQMMETGKLYIACLSRRPTPVQPVPLRAVLLAHVDTVLEYVVHNGLEYVQQGSLYDSGRKTCTHIAM